MTRPFVGVGTRTVEKAQMLKDNNLYPFFRSIEDSEGTIVQIDGKDQIMIGSNNYLGLTHHPHVKEQAIKAIEKYGTGCTGSRFLNGNLNIHEELEEKLAKYLGHEKALVFSTGMQTNLGALSAICGPRDCMLFDSENHASIIDASRLALGATFKYKHNNMEDLEEQLASNVNRFQKVIIVADGVFSMTGDIAKLDEMCALAEKYGAYVYVDDAHGIGVMGDRGRGTMDHFGVTDKVDFNMGTFSKSFASIGGVVSGSDEAMEYVKYNARSFMFSASMAPAAVATVSACLDVILSDDTIHTKLWKNVEFMRKGFKEIGFYTYDSHTPIIPVFIGDDLKSMQVTRFLADNGIFATPVIPPAVPKGEALIRTSYMATHNEEELSKVLEVFAVAKKEFEIPSCMQ
ncbi:pyridoxal phosphate-dependent aminotransferase family protein [Halobacteriovorax sp. GB3]|uniref:serine palmitoyltransferase n=1 Tax=Halobacteriovorax sp. GB3 TaxID=2719615 RepID=UPI00235F3EE2|nr:pyridoxal phosphate-dependent aminotransferase family protein [Halobacteriovorax sp. GB3]MDD0852248.1 pyridoxal phosphate-dependent aminotransferase family protein [Halobacteriovorax sp. GB3]